MQASAFIITYPVDNALDKEGNETKKAIAWEKAFIQLIKVCGFCICNIFNDQCMLYVLVMYCALYGYQVSLFCSFLHLPVDTLLSY